MAMREVLPFMNLMTEISDFLPIKSDKPNFYCTVWEDNRSCIKVAESPKFTPRTKHIALKYHHFRRYVSDGTLIINPIDTLEQTADILTKPLDGTKFKYLRMKLCGWWNYVGGDLTTNFVSEGVWESSLSTFKTCQFRVLIVLKPALCLA